MNKAPPTQEQEPVMFETYAAASQGEVDMLRKRSNIFGVAALVTGAIGGFAVSKILGADEAVSLTLEYSAAIGGGVLAVATGAIALNARIEANAFEHAGYMMDYY